MYKLINLECAHSLRGNNMKTSVMGRLSRGSRLLSYARALRMSAGYCVAVAFLAASVASAKEVTLPHKQLTLNGNLELATGKQFGDGVMLITHGGLAHRDMEMIAYLQKLLKERGYSTLAINLSLGLDNRHGMYDCAVTHRHTNDDAADEIGAWVGWLNKQGATRIVLLGHSRGGAQTALYAAQVPQESVKAVVLMAPATSDNTNGATYLKNFKRALPPLLKKAQKLRDGGKGSAVLTHLGLLSCADTSATAESFVSYYAQNPQNARLDTPSLLPKIKQPVLVVVAGEDTVVIGLDKKVLPLADGKHIQMKVISGADHTFRDLSTDDAVDATDAFLRSIGYGM